MTPSPPTVGSVRERVSPEADFRTLYDAAYADVLRFVQRRCHPSHAEDVAAEVFLVAWRRYADLPVGLDARRAWLFGVAHKTLANAYRSEQRRAALAVRIQDAYDGVEPGTHPDLISTRLDLGRAWQRLTPAQQEVLSLAVWDEVSSPQAAAILGISATAYRIRLSRARRALRSYLDPTPQPTPGAGPLPEGEAR